MQIYNIQTRRRIMTIHGMYVSILIRLARAANFNSIKS